MRGGDRSLVVGCWSASSGRDFHSLSFQVNNGECVRRIQEADLEEQTMNDSHADGKVGGEFLDELFSALEELETQSAGILQFLKDKGIANQQELAPYLE